MPQPRREVKVVIRELHALGAETMARVSVALGALGREGRREERSPR